MERACKSCRRLVRGNICAVCKTSELTRAWRGVLIVLSQESEIAKEAGITTPGRYAVKIIK
jgi:DNA-directed RNA polymerase subunit E"